MNGMTLNLIHVTVFVLASVMSDPMSRLSFGAGTGQVPKKLRVSQNHRYLEYEDGSPFFYLGDTAWELLHRPNREEADRYLANRAAKGFTVIQAVVLAELDGLKDPNPYGDTPLVDNDPTQPNEAYFRHVDYIVNKAQELGLHIGMLPTWGSRWKRGGIFTPENADPPPTAVDPRLRGGDIGRLILLEVLRGQPGPKPHHFAIASEASSTTCRVVLTSWRRSPVRS